MQQTLQISHTAHFYTHWCHFDRTQQGLGNLGVFSPLGDNRKELLRVNENEASEQWWT